MDGRAISPAHDTIVRTLAERTVRELGLDLEAEELHGYGFEGLFQAQERAFLDRLVDRHVMVAPRAMRDSLREKMKTAVANDPTFVKMVAEMRASPQAR